VAQEEPGIGPAESNVSKFNILYRWKFLKHVHEGQVVERLSYERVFVLQHSSLLSHLEALVEDLDLQLLLH